MIRTNEEIRLGESSELAMENEVASIRREG